MKEYVLKNVNIVDVVNDTIIEGKTVHVKDGKIDFNDQEGVKVLDAKGMYLVPGLIDLHVHLFGTGKPSNTVNGKGDSQAKLINFLNTKIGGKVLSLIYKGSLKTTLMSGTTTVRSVGDILYQDCKERDKINNHKYVGPRVVASGYAITCPGGHADGTISKSAITKEEFEELVKKNVEQHVDWIKIMVTSGVMDAKENKVDLMMNEEQVRWVTDKAHEYGLKVASHTESMEGIKLALRGGVDSIEHGSAIDDELIELYKKNNATLTVTMSPAIPYGALDSSVTHCTEVQSEIAKQVAKNIIDAANDAMDKGITFGLGTDASCPYSFHYGMARELSFFTKNTKASNEYAIKTATITNAKILGLDNIIGSIEEGKNADMFLVKENPYQNLKTLREPQMVIKDGFIINKPKIKKYKEFENVLDKLSD